MSSSNRPTDQADTVAGLLIEWEITRLLYGYASALDARDVDSVVACFTDDAHVELSGGEIVLDGAGQLHTHWKRSLRRNDASTHLIGNVIVDVDANRRRAEARSQATAFLLRAGRLIGRGLRYVDACVPTAAGWRISSRRHVADWQMEVSAVSVRSPATGAH